MLPDGKSEKKFLAYSNQISFGVSNEKLLLKIQSSSSFYILIIGDDYQQSHSR